MGRRYGRNQKRRHRERIAELEKLYSSTEKLLEYNAKERQRYYDMYKTIIKEIRTWWKNSVLVDAERIEVTKYPPYYRVVERKSLRSRDFMSPTAEIELHYQTLEALEIAGHEDFDMAFHIILTCGETAYKYYIDTRAFDQLEGMPEHMSKHVFREIQHAFMNRFSK